VVLNLGPEGGFNRFLFLLFLFLAITGSAVPFAYYLAYRFGGGSRAVVGAFRPLREGFLVGLYVVVVAWLRMNQALTPVYALLLLGVVVCIEIVALLRTR
jgi:hypothetical protein